MPRDDAKAAFARERRRRALARIASRLRSEPDDVSLHAPVRGGRRRARAHERARPRRPGDPARLDRRHRRPPPRRVRPRLPPAPPTCAARWERIAAARRRGEAMPPIDVYRIGDLHFVQDGHHRVSVARALRRHGHRGARARGADQARRRAASCELRDLPLKQHERVFHERVPLPPEQRARIQLSDEWRYAQLAMLVEAWGFRASHARGELLSRAEMAQRWFKEEYEPVVEALREADARRRRAPRPSATCASRCCATCSCTRTTWTDEIARAAARRGARPERRRGHDGPPDPQGDALTALPASSRFAPCGLVLTALPGITL